METKIFNNRYLLEEILGKGGFSQVWKAQDMQSGLEVAVKIFTRQDDEGVRLCRKEFAKTYNLRHPHILTPMHFDVVDNIPYLVMPYITGGSLDKRISSISAEEILKFVNQIGSALKFIHHCTNPVIHGDIKPDNILIDVNGNFLLTDFGISTALKEQFTKTLNIENAYDQPEGITPLAFRAPELNQYKNWETRSTSIKSDVWSAGVLLYYLCSKQLPFNGDGGLGQLIMMKTNQSEKVSDFIDLSNVPEIFHGLIEECLDLYADKRPVYFELNEKNKKSVVADKAYPKVPIHQARQKLPKVLAERSKEQQYRKLVILLSLLALGFTLVMVMIMSSHKNPILNIAFEDDPELSEFELSDEEADKYLASVGQMTHNTLLDDIKENKSKEVELNYNAISNSNRNVLTVENVRDQNPSLSINELSKDKKTNEGTDRRDVNMVVDEIQLIEKPTKAVGSSNTERKEVEAISETFKPNSIVENTPEKKSMSSTRVAANIPVKLVLKNTIPLENNLKAGDRVVFSVMEDAMGQSAIFLTRGTEINAIVKSAGKGVLKIDFPSINSSGGTTIKTYKSRFDIIAKKGADHLAKAGEYQVVIYTNELKEVKL